MKPLIKHVILVLIILKQSPFLNHQEVRLELKEKVKSSLIKRIADENISDCKLTLIHNNHVPHLISIQGRSEIYRIYNTLFHKRQHYTIIYAKQEYKNSISEVDLVYEIEKEVIDSLYEINRGMFNVIYSKRL